MKLIIISTGWNCENYITEYIQSLKNQIFKNFTVFLIDDASTDNTVLKAKLAIDSDIRFNLICNDTHLWKTANFVKIINNNKLINDDDVIIEIDADDKLSNDTVLEDINKIYQNTNIWISGSRWMNNLGVPNTSWSNGKVVPENARFAWRFSHMRSYRAFLFRAIRDNDLKINNEYHKAACDIGYTIPMLEMAGSEHYYFLDKITYIYTRHKNHSGTVNSSHGDNNLQRKTADHIMKLPKYSKLIK